MVRDLTSSIRDRQNILNNRYALEYAERHLKLVVCDITERLFLLNISFFNCLRSARQRLNATSQLTLKS